MESNHPIVYVYTRVYNAEKTIRRCIESIINQTYKNIIYMILDNGSSDNTYAIMKEYADQDNRILTFHYNVNGQCISPEEKQAEKYIRDIYYNRNEEQYYFCLLDADDEYTPTFFEDALNYANKENLDIVIGGSMLIDTVTLEVTNRVYNHQIVISGNDFGSYFKYYHWNLRQVWGKLYKSNVLKDGLEWYNDLITGELGFDQTISYGSDTLVTSYRFSKANRIGTLAGAYHKYYFYPRSISYKLDPNRIRSDQILYKYIIEYLEKKVGYVSYENQVFIYEVYYYAIKDTLDVLLHANVSLVEKFSGIREVFSNKITRDMYLFDGIDGKWKENLTISIIDWLISCHNCYDTQLEEILAEILVHMNKDFFKLIELENLKWFVLNLPEVIRSITVINYVEAFEQLKSAFDQNVKQINQYDFTIVLAQTLAAVLEYSNEYSYFSKLFILWCIENDQLISANEELSQWEQILPEDEDLKALRLKLTDTEKKNV